MDDQNKAWNAPPQPRAKRQNDDHADRPLAVGDVVVLKSGGHAMTIEKFVTPAVAPTPGLIATQGFAYTATDVQAHCIWQSKDGHFLDRVLWPHTIARVGDDKRDTGDDRDHDRTAMDQRRDDDQRRKDAQEDQRRQAEAKAEAEAAGDKARQTLRS